MALPTSKQRHQISQHVHDIEFAPTLDERALAGIALRDWVISDFAGQVGADPPRAVRLGLVARELMALVGCAASRLPIVEATLEELGSNAEHRTARKHAAFAVASAWHPFINEMEVDELRRKLRWLGESHTGGLFALRTRLKSVCATRDGQLESKPVPWISYHGRMNESSGGKVRSFSFGRP